MESPQLLFPRTRGYDQKGERWISYRMKWRVGQWRQALLHTH